MKKRPRKTIRRRHLTVVLLLFIGMTSLIVMVHLRAPLDLPTAQPPDLAAKRIDKQNNGYYIFMEAVDMLPPLPPPLEVHDEAGRYPYKPKDNSLGMLLKIDRPDDDPLLIEYVQKSLPAIEHALKALEKPYFLFPVDLDDDFSVRSGQSRTVARLPEVCFAHAAINPCSEDADRDACRFFHDSARLAAFMSQRNRAVFPFTASAADVIQKASPGHQRKIAAWLAEFRAQLDSPDVLLEEHLRRIYRTNVPASMKDHPFFMRTAADFMNNRLKRAVRLHDAECRQGAAMTYFEYDQYRKQHPKFLKVNTSGMHDHFLLTNSLFYTEMDGLAIVIGLESFRRDHGQYAESLTELVPQYMPELPGNPFTGRQFNYARVDNSYILSTVGGRRQGDSWSEYQHILVYSPEDMRENYWRKLRKMSVINAPVRKGEAK